MLDRVLAPAGVRPLAVDGPHRDPFGATAGGDRETSGEGSTAAAGQPGRCRAGSRPPRVLLVDDSPAMRRVLRGLLEDAGIRRRLPEVQVVMFSSAEGVGGGILARQAGASAFVAKGSPPEQLCAAVLAAWQPPAGSS